jgi:hypothetical protein
MQPRIHPAALVLAAFITASQAHAQNHALLAQKAKEMELLRAERLSSMAANLKLLKVGFSTRDDVITKLGKPIWSANDAGYETMSFNYGIAYVAVQLDPNGIVNHLSASKHNSGSNEIVYSAGNKFIASGPSTSGSMAADVAPTFVDRRDTSPANPKEGQIYFNVTEKIFYGWNGSDWIKLGSN